MTAVDSKLIGHRGNSIKGILIGVTISLAGFINGIDTGIIASTIAQDTFKLYMYGESMENASLRAGIVSGYYAGYAVGSAASAYCMDKISRRWTLFLGSVISVIGAVIQTAAINPTMMILGRALSGASSGLVYPTAPVYLAELSAPENRGFLVGLKGLMNTFGFGISNWIGYGGSFAVGDLQWRIPLATQAPPALLLAILCFFLPYSPRWLAQKERYDDAKKVMEYLHSHRTSEFIEEEYKSMYDQIRLEQSQRNLNSFSSLFTRRYARRLLLACLTVNMMKLSGSNVINNYQSVMYNSLGYEGQQVLLIGGLYGFMAIIGQIINVFFIADHWTRRTTLISGYVTLVVLLGVLTGLSERFSDDTNPHGSRAGVAFIFLFSFAFSFFFNSVNWTILSEIMPLHIRGVGVGFAVFTQSITAIWLSYAASIAFDAISWRFYFVFIACNAFAGLAYYFFLPETRFLTLEEVAAKFGDEVVNPMHKDLISEDTAESTDKKDVVHVEAEKKD
ncbi:general substrate transporter [Stachybotrys elegans]|uniref:General substrate transporter n=1 Tax=Stachybotrys elegans TaxID=80388 RepID=A0A8K0WMD6_9HYPO|nr:general substrate transporter [Stachybotrys elegans]